MDPKAPRRVLLGTTRWSLVRRAAVDGAAAGEWASACWYPLYSWARKERWSPEDAADAVQEFLGKVCGKGLLENVQPGRGRFRSWLLTSFRNHLATKHTAASRLKRGGNAAHIPFDASDIESFYQSDMAALPEPDRAYTRAWALTLMDEAMERLARHFADSGREPLFQALLPALEGAMAEQTFESAGKALGLTGAAMRQAALRFRQRYRRLLLEVAGERLGITCEAQLREELRDLLSP